MQAPAPALAKYLDRSFFTLPLDGGGRGWGCSGVAIPYAMPRIPPHPDLPPPGGRSGEPGGKFMSQYLDIHALQRGEVDTL